MITFDRIPEYIEYEGRIYKKTDLFRVPESEREEILKNGVPYIHTPYCFMNEEG